RVAILGDSHPEVARNLASLAFVSERENDFPAARKYLEQLRKIGGPVWEEGHGFRVVRILFGTDRAPLDEEGRLGFGAETGRQLKLGLAAVTVPITNTIVGEAARPRRVAGLQFFWETESPRLHATLSELEPATSDRLSVYVRDVAPRANIFPKHALLVVH